MSDKLNIFLAGQKSFGAAVLKALINQQGINLMGVSCPMLPKDRLFNVAKLNDLPIIPAGLLKAETLPLGVDLIICAHSHDFIGRKTRLKSKLGAIGYHPSLLPLHRGRDAVYWTLRFNDKISGGSVYWLDDGVDAGNIAAQEWCFVQPDDTVQSLWRRELFPMGVRLILQTIENLQNGLIISIPQDNRLASWEPSIDREPLPRPDLPLLGTLPGYTVICEKQAT